VNEIDAAISSFRYFDKGNMACSANGLVVFHWPAQLAPYPRAALDAGHGSKVTDVTAVAGIPRTDAPLFAVAKDRSPAIFDGYAAAGIGVGAPRLGGRVGSLKVPARRRLDVAKNCRKRQFLL
jgi:hypothetical protein